MKEPTEIVAIARLMAPALRTRGFRRREATFWRIDDEATRRIQVRATASVPEDPRDLEVGLAVYNAWLGERRFFSRSWSFGTPWHWSRCLRAAPRQWVVGGAADIDRIALEMMGRLESEGAFEEIEKRSSVEGLAELWRAGIGTGVSERLRRDFLYDIDGTMPPPTPTSEPPLDRKSVAKIVEQGLGATVLPPTSMDDLRRYVEKQVAKGHPKADFFLRMLKQMEEDEARRGPKP